MSKKFICKKDLSFGIFLVISGLVIIGVSIVLPFLTDDNYSLSKLIITTLIITQVFGLYFWLWFGTNYSIDNDKLIVRFGPFIWRVAIKEITLIRLNQKTIGGIWKPTLSWNCIEIKYKKDSSISLSPVDESEFLDRLLNVNDKIKIKPK